MNPPTDLAIVIVGLNARHYVQQCLVSLAKTEWRGLTQETIYVDNGSSDGSPDVVRDEFPEVTLIANSTNLGFCQACNQGAKASHSRYVFYLNDDTLVFEDTIPKLVRFLNQKPDALAAGCRLVYPDMREQWSARRFPTWRNALFGRKSALSRYFPNARVVRRYLYKDQMERGDPFVVDWIPGSCTLVRREAVERIGGLPEDLHYWSDAVFCSRLMHANTGKIYLVPSSTLIHIEGKGSGAESYESADWKIRDFHRGAYAFYCEYHRLGSRHPARWVAVAGLGARAGMLLCANWMKHTFGSAERHRPV